MPGPPRCSRVELALWLLRDARAPARLLGGFDTWSPVMREAGRTRAGLDALEPLIEYMFRVVDRRYRGELRAKLRALGPISKEATVTIAEMYEKQGRVKGRAEGRVEGRAEALRRLLVVKFRTLDAAAEARLQAATPKLIDRYLRRVLTAESLAEVFDEGARRRSGRPRSRGPRRRTARTIHG